uniref:Capping actin protein, gelsolin like n=1 Tax=Otus sunia TaxID=257818 RepID=A0A8C8B5Z4_9STRI
WVLSIPGGCSASSMGAQPPWRVLSILDVCSASLVGAQPPWWVLSILDGSSPPGAQYLCWVLGLPGGCSASPVGAGHPTERSAPLCRQEGGVDSAFKSTRPGAGPGPVRKLYQVKGKKNIRASEREPSWASFNTGDCFILDLGQSLLAWCGAKPNVCNVLERNRAQELAAAIRDGERGGKAGLEIVVDGEEPPEMLQVLGPKPPLQEGSPEEDVMADQRNAGAAVLYKVSDATGRMDLSQVATSSPFSQSLLCPDDCFVLDNGAGGKVYVWKGAWGQGRGERQRAGAPGGPESGRGGHRPHGPLVEILPQGRETPLFKQFFTSWK